MEQPKNIYIMTVEKIFTVKSRILYEIVSPFLFSFLSFSIFSIFRVQILAIVLLWDFKKSKLKILLNILRFLLQLCPSLKMSPLPAIFSYTYTTFFVFGNSLCLSREKKSFRKSGWWNWSRGLAKVFDTITS